MASFEQSRTIAASVADLRVAINEINKQAPAGQGFVWNQAKTSAKTASPDGNNLEVRIKRAGATATEVTVVMSTSTTLDPMQTAMLEMMAPQVLNEILSVIEEVATKGVGLGL